MAWLALRRLQGRAKLICCAARSMPAWPRPIAHAGKALAQAFLTGVVTAVPPEAKAVAVALDSIGDVSVDPSPAPIDLRTELVSLLRRPDPIGVRELLNHERQHFERGVLERLRVAGDALGLSADPDRLKPLEEQLWTLVERRLATLLPLVEYDAELLARELESLSLLIEHPVPTRTPTAAWKQGHRWVVWLLTWTVGVAASTGSHWAAARALWETQTLEDEERVPLAAMRQLAGFELGDRLTLARFGKRMPLDGLWHLAFSLARSELIIEHYSMMLQGDVNDRPLGFLSRAGDWAWCLAALSGRDGGRISIPQYWHGSQVHATLPDRLRNEPPFRSAIAAEFLQVPVSDVDRCARKWVDAAPAPV